MVVQSNIWPPSGKQVRNGTSRWIPPFTRKAPSLLLADETEGLASKTEVCRHEPDTLSPAQASGSIHQSIVLQNTQQNRHRIRPQSRVQTQPRGTAAMNTTSLQISVETTQLPDEFEKPGVI